jgi:hypothetical protein
MTARTRQILARLPSHLEPARPGKVLSAVVDALAQDLDVLAARLAAVRRAHRLGEADEIVDLLRIGALHGISAAEVELLFMRFARVRKLMVDVEKAAGPDRDAAAEALIALWPVPAAEPRLPLYAPVGGGDLAAARARLLEHATAALRYDRLTAALQARIGAICMLHAQGNGTVQSVMAGAANALDLEIGPVIHSDDRFWHAAPVHDRLRLTRPVEVIGSDGGTSETAVPFDPAQEVIGIEENPWYRASTDITGRSHGELWSVIRRGFEHAVARIHITGVERGRTIGPMLVNRDEGRGIGYVGTVPDGDTLVFTEEGRALLDGADVTSSAYAWEGGCFADAGGATGELDFVFDGGTRPAGMLAAWFVTATPPNALDREAVRPHADVTLPMPGIGLGETRFAFFVQEAHFNSLEGAPAAIRLVVPRTRAAFHDASVLAPAGEPRTAAADVSLSWMERRAFHARLLIPARFRGFEGDPEATEVRRRVAAAVERFRPVGVELVIEFVDDRWVLGGSVLHAGDPGNLIEQLQSGMVLWEAPAG